MPQTLAYKRSFTEGIAQSITFWGFTIQENLSERCREEMNKTNTKPLEFDEEREIKKSLPRAHACSAEISSAPRKSDEAPEAMPFRLRQPIVGARRWRSFWGI